MFTFTTASDVGIAETDEIWIKFPRQYDEVIQAYSGFNDYVRYPW